MTHFPILSALIVTPAVGAAVVLFLPSRLTAWIRAAGYLTTLVALGFAVWLLADFSTGHAGYQFTESARWIGDLGIKSTLGVDGISIFMVVLTALLFPVALLASVTVTERVKAFVVWMLVLEAALLGVFLALDLVFFFVFFELVLVPMYFLILGWGHGRRSYAAVKFFVFTAAGSAFLLIGILVLAFLHSDATGKLTFDLQTLVAWAPHGLDPATSKWLFVAFFAAFAVKVPLFPLHTWLPDAHTEAPTAGSVILAGVLLKMGVYGFLRFSIPLFPVAARDLAPALLVLATIGIIYGAIVAAMQLNVKRIVAYSSVAHMGFAVLGVFALTTQGLDGAVFTMVSHGLTTGALFLLLGMLYDRRHTYAISAYGGLWKAMPILGGLFCAAVFASIGLPGFSGFVGEFLALIGTFVVQRPYAVVSAIGVILAAVYLLWAFQRVFMARPSGPNAKLPDASWREIACVVPLLALSLFLGLYPQPVLERIEPSLKAVIHQVESNTDYREPGVSTKGSKGALTTPTPAQRTAGTKQ